MSFSSIGLRFNAIFEKYMFLIIPLSMIGGMVFSERLVTFVPLVPYFFAYVTFVMAIGCNLEQMKLVLKRPGTMAVTFILAHIVSPVVAYGIGLLVFGAGSPYIIGLVLFAVIPLGVSSVIWVGLSGGSIPLMLAMIVIDSAASPFVVPALIRLFFGADIAFDHWSIMLDLLLIIVAPTILGVLLNEWTRGAIKAKAGPILTPVSKLGFVTVVLLNAAAIEPYVVKLSGDLGQLIPAVILLVSLCYAVGFFGSFLFRDPEMYITLSYATGMRNISLGLVLALGYFGPLVAVPVVMSILIQQPIATVHHWVLNRYKRKFTKTLQTKL
jgi:bile acid:Na+ symporter, BASS family